MSAASRKRAARKRQRLARRDRERSVEQAKAQAVWSLFAEHTTIPEAWWEGYAAAAMAKGYHLKWQVSSATKSELQAGLDAARHEMELQDELDPGILLSDGVPSEPSAP